MFDNALYMRNISNNMTLMELWRTKPTWAPCTTKTTTNNLNIFKNITLAHQWQHFARAINPPQRSRHFNTVPRGRRLRQAQGARIEHTKAPHSAESRPATQLQEGVGVIALTSYRRPWQRTKACSEHFHNTSPVARYAKRSNHLLGILQAFRVGLKVGSSTFEHVIGALGAKGSKLTQRISRGLTAQPLPQILSIVND